MRPLRGAGGFTLIELLIVIVILGVLAGIVVFAVSAFTDDGEVVACRADTKNVEVATEAYRAKTGLWPTAIGGTATTTLVGAGYLKEAPNSTKYTVTITGATVTGSAC
jgi:general secretion pathway protein G